MEEFLTALENHHEAAVCLGIFIIICIYGISDIVKSRKK